MLFSPKDKGGFGTVLPRKSFWTTKVGGFFYKTWWIWVLWGSIALFQMLHINP